MSQRVSRVAPKDLAALRHLALAGGLSRGAKISSNALAKRLETSRQTAARRLRTLESANLVSRNLVSDGQVVSITSAGEKILRHEYESYRQLFDEKEPIVLEGCVTSGMGEGRHYISLPGYTSQFRERLGYEPFPGTLNVELSSANIGQRTALTTIDPIQIDGWKDENRTYGPAKVYPATIESGPDRYDTAHVIEPERTHHDESQLELLAPERLRDTLNLDDGQEVTIYVG